MTKDSPSKKTIISKKDQPTSKNSKSISNHYDVSIKSSTIMEKNRLERMNEFKNL